MTTRRALAAVTAAGLLALVSLPGAPAYAEDATSPAGSVGLPGEDVEMSSDADAPTEITAGVWRGDLGPAGSRDGTRWFEYRRTSEDSTLLASVVSPGATPGAPDAIEVEVLDAAGESCTISSATDSRGDDPRPLTTATAVGVQEVTLTEDEQEFGGFECLTESRLLVAVTRGTTGEEGEAPFALRVVEESSLASADGLEKAVERPEPEGPDVDSEREELDGGPGLEDAPEVTDGRYRGSTTTDRTVVYRVPDVGWGQTLRTAVELDPVELDDSVFSGPTASLTVLTPLLTTLGAGEPESASLDGEDSVQLVTGAGPVRYLNRTVDFQPAAYVPGDHYVLLTVEAPDDGPALDVDYTLEVQVAGEPADAPDFTEPDAYTVADGVASPTVTAPGAGGLLARVGSVLRYGGAALLGLVGLVALVAGVRTLRT